jgi:Protein of unknown function (DUF3168)
MSAALDLQKAVIARLSSDAALVAQLGGAKIFDHPAANAKLPYVTLGQTASYDWSTASEDGREHLLTVHVWSRAGGRIEAHAIMEMVRLRLLGLTQDLVTHRLVLLMLEFEDVRFDVSEDGYHGMLRYRALTENSP